MEKETKKQRICRVMGYGSLKEREGTWEEIKV